MKPLEIWLCYGTRPDRRVATVWKPSQTLPPTLSTILSEPTGANYSLAVCGRPCRVEVFELDDDLTTMHGGGARIFYTFARITVRPLTKRERVALRI